ncbi:DNA recombination protein RmuC [Candidatus Shapirobacteria bacterium]|nr:DNA recombination protein RmuC [Candidatus Shapirobacteria bacterium]
MILVYILLLLILGTLVFLIYRQSKQKPVEIDINNAIDILVKQANEKLDDKNKQSQIDLLNKKDSIEKMVKQVLDQLNSVERERVSSFTGLRDAIESTSKITKELSATTEGLKRTLSSDRMRGAFGEKVAEDLLKQSGFVIGTDYSKQESFEQGRPDFTIYLPDKTKINIDAKFPYANIVKMSETENLDQKAQFLKSFEGDIKRKITDVSSRNYINPEDNTVDFVVVFIPNEMIFSFIYEKFPNILEEAFNKKIVFAGPFSFTAILRMVRQAYENFRFQKNVKGIITQIKIFETEFVKYNEEFSKLGDRIDSLHKQYNEVGSTRTKKLQKVIDKIKIEDNISHALPE